MSESHDAVTADLALFMIGMLGLEPDEVVSVSVLGGPDETRVVWTCSRLVSATEMRQVEHLLKKVRGEYN